MLFEFKFILGQYSTRPYGWEASMTNRIKVRLTINCDIVLSHSLMKSVPTLDVAPTNPKILDLNKIMIYVLV